MCVNARTHITGSHDTALCDTQTREFKFCSLERNQNIISLTLWKALTLHYDNEQIFTLYFLRLKMLDLQDNSNNVDNECGARGYTSAPHTR